MATKHIESIPGASSHHDSHAAEAGRDGARNMGRLDAEPGPAKTSEPTATTPAHIAQASLPVDARHNAAGQPVPQPAVTPPGLSPPTGPQPGGTSLRGLAPSAAEANARLAEAQRMARQAPGAAPSEGELDTVARTLWDAYTGTTRPGDASWSTIQGEARYAWLRAAAAAYALLRPYDPRKPAPPANLQPVA